MNVHLANIFIIMRKCMEIENKKVICHLCLHGPYNEGWNYQENILPKYHSIQGYTVYQVVTPYMWDKDKIVVSKDTEYVNKNGVTVIRCCFRKRPTFGGRITHYPEVMSLLNRISPNILFVHDVQCLDIVTIVRYLKLHEDCVVYVDNHSDFSNSARNWVSKNILHKVLWRHMAKIINPYVTRFYGVLPARVDFLIDLYKLPKEKCALLLMGADDEYVEKALNENSIRKKRFEIGVDGNRFLIVTGGKIDIAKTQTLYLMEAVKKIKNNIELVVFGSVATELKEQFDSLCQSENIHYLGWISAEESYDIFAAADLVAFPGRHSVYWEQAAALGKPMILKYWEGTTHIDAGGNIKYLYKDNVEEIEKVLEEILHEDNYRNMLEKAEKNRKRFLYSEIAKISIDD